MDLREYYGFPEGTNVTLKYASFYDLVDDNFPCPNNMAYAFAYESRSCLKKLNTSNVTLMNSMLANTQMVDTEDIKDWDTSKVTDMNRMFEGCTTLKHFYANWNTSNVTKMEYMFNSCNKLETIDFSKMDTSKVTSMSSMLQSINSLKSISYMNCISVAKDKYPLKTYSTLNGLTDLGGFYMRNSWTDTIYGLANCPNLTVESLVNVLNALYDFTGNGETPTSNEGKLALGATNLAKLTDEQKAIATNKGWTLS